MTKPIVYVDCDDVLNDFFDQAYERMVRFMWQRRERFPYIPGKVEMTRWDAFMDYLTHDEKMFIFDEAFVLATPLPVEIRYLEVLQEYLDIHILTAVESNWELFRRAWLRVHVPSVPPEKVIVDKDKSKYSGHILIDDGPHNIEAYDGLRIVKSAPYNWGIPCDDRTFRIQSLKEVVPLLQKLGVI